MHVVNIFEAKTQLSKLIEAVESGAEEEIVIARNGKPAARLVALAPGNRGQRIGVAKGLFTPPEPDPQADELIAKLFRGGV